jgi:hypothetical protein
MDDCARGRGRAEAALLIREGGYHRRDEELAEAQRARLGQAKDSLPSHTKVHEDAD